jgi:hypothetical protein
VSHPVINTPLKLKLELKRWTTDARHKVRSS